MHSPPLIIWRFSDGKPGHDKQSLGLAAALRRLTAVQICEIALPQAGAGLLAWLVGDFAPGRALPAPRLLVGAGHATHLPMLAARRARRGARIVVLMQPSLPLALFDLCLIPAHDRPPQRANVVATCGALNTVSAAASHDEARGLFLVGGPSRHYRWDDGEVAAQVSEIALRDASVEWTLCTSRRTPDSFLAALAAAGARLRVVRHQDTPGGWLETELAGSGRAWVTPDSVSMVYEALSAGCLTGLIELPAQRSSRVARGIAELAAAGSLLPIAQWRRGGSPPRVSAALNEAERCARLILARWP